MVRHLYSGNGTNFVGADNLMKAFYGKLQADYEKLIAPKLAAQRTTWHFSPLQSPNFGGLWEAGVKSVKYHLKRIIADRRLTYEELSTVLISIEACLNSRPLCPLSADADDLDLLTPAHFLIGDSLLAPPEYRPQAKSFVEQFLIQQSMIRHFWRAWSRDWLAHLQQRPKWCQEAEGFQLNDLVIIKDDRFPPSQWLLGRLVELHPGTDALVRVAHVRYLFKLPGVEKGSASSLRQLNDKANSHLRALAILASTKEIFDGHLIVSKLDIQTQERWEEGLPSKELPNWDKFSSFLDLRCRMMENLEYAKFPKIKLACKKITIFPVAHGGTMLQIIDNVIAECSGGIYAIKNCSESPRATFCHLASESSCAKELHAGGVAHCRVQESDLHPITYVDEGIIIINDRSAKVRVDNGTETWTHGTHLITFEKQATINGTLFINHNNTQKRAPGTASLPVLNITATQDVLSLPYLHRLSERNLEFIKEFREEIDDHRTQSANVSPNLCQVHRDQIRALWEKVEKSYESCSDLLSVSIIAIQNTQADFVNNEIKELLQNGIIRPSRSPYNSPTWVVDKKGTDDNGSKKKRLVIDFRKLNERTIADRYPMPSISMILANFGKAKFFTTLDLKSGYHQIYLAEKDREKTSFSVNEFRPPEVIHGSSDEMKLEIKSKIDKAQQSNLDRVNPSRQNRVFEVGERGHLRNSKRLAIISIILLSTASARITDFSHAKYIPALDGNVLVWERYGLVSHSTNLSEFASIIDSTLTDVPIDSLMDDLRLRFLVQYPRVKRICKKVLLFPVAHYNTMLQMKHNIVAECDDVILAVSDCASTNLTTFCKKASLDTCARQLHAGGAATCGTHPSNLERLTIVDDGVIIVNEKLTRITIDDGPTTTIIGTHLITFESKAVINNSVYLNLNYSVNKSPEIAASPLINITGHDHILSLPLLQRMNEHNLRLMQELRDDASARGFGSPRESPLASHYAAWSCSNNIAGANERYPN
ncbi:hypothetical protein KR054_007456 [Drosophila jambulina]|nr:hypothetical protein KR054_007456 [Drosophila jambulina]